MNRSLINRLRNWSHQNLANFVTAIGLLLTFWCLETIYHHPEQLKQILIIGLAAVLTDYLDGKIARRYNIESLVGSLLDRMRDRVFIYPILFVVAWRYRWKLMSLPFPSITIPLAQGAIIGMFIIEGLLLTAFVLGVIWHFRGSEIDFSPNRWGQKKMYCGFVMVLIWLVSLTVEQDFGYPLINLTIFVLYLGFVLWLYWGTRSVVTYATNATRKIEPKNKKAQGET